LRDNRHDSAWIFGAVCPERAVGAAIIMPAVNSEAMAEHLAEISRQVDRGAHAVLVCDGAGWHQPGEPLPIPSNISLLPLPPYAPELNPIETLWEYLRGNHLSTRLWNSYQRSFATAPQPGNASWPTRNAFAPSPPGNGQRSEFKAVGITPN
jgi:hypothetical protein